MKKKNNFILLSTLFGICLCICTLLSGCGEPEAPQPEVTLNIKVNSSLTMKAYADKEIRNGYDFLLKASEDFCKTYEDARVTIHVTEIDSMREEQEISDAFDTPNAPDVLLKEYINMSTYLHTGRVVPLDDIISNAIREDIPEEYWEISALNGQTYMMPFLGMQNVLAYNKNLFVLAGLEKYISHETMVQSWTLEEWNHILSTLKKNLPDACYPMMMYAADEQGDTHIMTLLRSHGSPLFDENGRFCLNSAEGIAAIQWLQECNQKNYFPPNSDTLVILDNQALFLNQQLAIYVMNSNLEIYAREAGIDYGLVNFPSLDGRGYNTTFLTGFEVFDNGDSERLRVAKDFVKFIYESRWLEYSAGSMPVSRKVSEKYAEELMEMKPYIENKGQALDITGNNPNWRGVRNVFYPHIADLLYGEKTPEEIAAEIDADCNSAIEEGAQALNIGQY